MVEKKSAKKNTQTSARSSAESEEKFTGLTDDERAAMKERTKELKAEARAEKNKAEGESDVRAKIDEMTGTDRSMAERLHEIITESAPTLMPRTWYGMPAYAKDGKVVCYFRPAAKFKQRYAIFGFEDAANLDQGAMWPTVFALTELTAKDEETIGKLVKKAVS
jgi:uncharacterized protein YdhG (YjbR/CyaY superfamily)